MTDGEKRIAELHGSLAVIETLLAVLMDKLAQSDELNLRQIQRHLEGFRNQAKELPEDQWAEHHRQGMAATATRLGANLKIRAV